MHVQALLQNFEVRSDWDESIFVRSECTLRILEMMPTVLRLASASPVARSKMLRDPSGLLLFELAIRHLLEPEELCWRARGEGDSRLSDQVPPLPFVERRDRMGFSLSPSKSFL